MEIESNRKIWYNKGMNIRDIYNLIMEFFSVDRAVLTVDPSLADIINGGLRILMPVVAILILVRCALSLLRGKNKPEIWAYLKYPDDSYKPITHWENLLGCARSADLMINDTAVAKAHAVLSRRQKGAWYLCDVGGKEDVKVNGKTVKGEKKIKFGDVISLGGVECTLVAPTSTEVIDDCQAPQKSISHIEPLITLVFLSVFSLMGMLGLLVNVRVNPYLLLLVFGGINLVMWGYFFLMRAIQRVGMEIEWLAFFLTILGFCAVASADPYGLLKQFIALMIGLGLFLLLGWCLRDLSRSQVMRWIMSGLGIVLLLITFIFADTINGARNWLFIGGMSIQPSELAKICFVYAGAATLDRLLTKRNLLLYLLFSAICVGLLALMNDFGTAIIFFVTFIIVAFLRSGQFSAFILGGASAGLAAFMVLQFRPYVLNRFKAWRNVWAYPDSLGYQQTRVLACVASGGLFGLGIGRGWLKYVAASDTDLVFGMLCEEWGLLVALTAISVIVIFALFTIKMSREGRSAFFAIASCAAVGMLVFQTMLNVCGSVDILPLTGVTFPFVSNGGSSMLCSWGLLAFVKAADVRPSASFAIKHLPLRYRRGRHE